jgi:hypothetical protein
VRVVNRMINLTTIVRLNKVTLSVMDSNRKVIFEHTFTGIDVNSPATFDFNLEGRVSTWVSSSPHG